MSEEQQHDTDEDENRRDLYAVLELPREATDEEIRLAFRKIAARNHPDRNIGDAKAALRFKRANAAYQVLSDPEKKQLYDDLTTPVEEMPEAPPAQALARQEDAKEWRASDDTQRASTRRVRRRVRKSGGLSRNWSIVLGAGAMVLVAWLLVPDGSGVQVVAGATQAKTDGGSALTSVTDPLSDHAGMGHSTDPVMAPVGNLRGRTSVPSAPEVESPTRTVTGDRWSFAVPTDWQNATDAKGTLWKGPASATGETPSVRLVVSSFAGDSAAYFKALERRTRSGVVVDEEAWESESQPDGLKREGRMIAGGAVVSRFVEYAVAAKGQGYELTCSAPVVAFESVEPTCERILGSLQIK